ncbi:unnamed protein product, partial [Durusdinium trenchii]
QYDETPLTLRIGHLSSEDKPPLPILEDSTRRIGKGRKTKDAQTCKLFLTELRWCALFVEDGTSDTDRVTGMHLESQLVSPLQVLAGNTAELMAEALLVSGAMRLDALANSKFQRVLSIVTTDDLSANTAAERLLSEREKELYPGVDFGKLHLPCEVHKCHGIAKSMFQLLPDFTSGLIKAALALRSGHMRQLRLIVKDLIRDKLRIYRATPSFTGSDSSAFRDHMMKVFFSTCTSAEKASVVSLFNGDWSDPEIQHVCLGCCSSREHTIHKMETLALPVFLWRGPRVFPRHKWVGADDSLDWFGRLLALHSLLPEVMRRLFGPRAHGRPSQAGDTAEPESALLESIEHEAFSALAAYDASQGPTHDAEAEDDYRVIFKRWRQQAYDWACNYKDLQGDLLFSRLALAPQCELMNKQLFLASGKWDEQQFAHEAEHGSRMFRVLETHQNVAVSKAIEQVISIAKQDFFSNVPCELWTMRHSHQLFRLLMRVGASAHHYLYQRHKRYPYKLFALLQEDGEAVKQAGQDILRDFQQHPCTLCAFSMWFLKHDNRSSSLDALISRRSLLELASIATECAVDICHTECQHASNRRLVEGKSLHTYQADLAEASSHYVARVLRSTSWRGIRSVLPNHMAPDKVRAKPGPKKKEKVISNHYQKARARGQPLRRGGGERSVFLSEQGALFPGTPEAKRQRALLAQKYKALPDAERKRLRDKAFSVRQAKKYGANQLVRRLKPKRPALALADAAHAHVNISGAPAICDSRSSDLSLEAVVLQEKALAKQLRSQKNAVELARMKDLAQANISTLLGVVEPVKRQILTSPKKNEGEAADWQLGIPVAGEDVVPISPCVPMARSSTALDVSASCMNSAWKRLKKLEEGSQDGRLQSLDKTWEQRHDMITGSSFHHTKPPPDKHKRCRCAGVPFCRGWLEPLRKRFAAAIVAMCSSRAKLKDKLVNGLLVLHLSGVQTQALLEGKTLSGQSVEAGLGISERRPSETMWLHISFVWGGLKQFFPVFGVLQQPNNSAEQAGSHVDLTFDSKFEDFYELLQKLDVNMQWSAELYELVNCEKVVGNLVPAVCVAQKTECPPYVAWKGASAYRSEGARQRPAAEGPRTAKRNASTALELFLEDGQGQEDQTMAVEGNSAETQSHASVDLDGEQVYELEEDSENDVDFDAWQLPADAPEVPIREEVLMEALALALDGQDETCDLESARGGAGEEVATEAAMPPPPAPSSASRAEERFPDSMSLSDLAAVPLEEVRGERVETHRREGPRQSHEGLPIRGEDGGNFITHIKHKPQANDVFIRCPKHPSCFKTKTLNASDRSLAQGRPLAFLMAWAWEADSHPNKSEHIRLCKPSFEKRKKARQMLKEESNSGTFLDLERPPREGEGSEPENCP